MKKIIPLITITTLVLLSACRNEDTDEIIPSNENLKANVTNNRSMTAGDTDSPYVKMTADSIYNEQDPPPKDRDDWIIGK